MGVATRSVKLIVVGTNGIAGTDAANGTSAVAGGVMLARGDAMLVPGVCHHNTSATSAIKAMCSQKKFFIPDSVLALNLPPDRLMAT